MRDEFTYGMLRRVRELYAGETTIIEALNGACDNGMMEMWPAHRRIMAELGGGRLFLSDYEAVEGRGICITAIDAAIAKMEGK